ncbi:protein RFT1 homolog [Diachasma alloeum]|uniref:protein RFT1 homolog n=1 Tax=Diachasma alloeum TaxID=454923 RepID=UPI0007381505|nr:protein RFT1 homolog [Diachasma alloeum]
MSVLNSSLENASFNIIFQIFCRLVTFGLNVFVVRNVGEAVLGIMNVRLLLLESTILFLSREPFFKACLTNAVEHNWAQVVNLLWLTIPICSLMSLLFGYIWLYVLTTSETLPDYYTFAVISVALSCVIHLLSLVVQLVSSAFLFNRFKVVIDTTAIVFRTFLFVPMVFHWPERALLAFGVAQLAYVIFYSAAHYIYFYCYIQQLNEKKKSSKKNDDEEEEEEKKKKEKEDSADGEEFKDDQFIIRHFPFQSVRDFFPGQLKNHQARFNEKLTVLTWSFFRQGILKYVLTEGERIIMTVFPVITFAEQGTYDVVNNLGSLAARFIFRPIEESGYFYFTQVVKRDKSINEQNPVRIRESVEVLTHLCSIVTSIGLIVLVFGQTYSSTLLWIYGGTKFTARLPVCLMQAHCLAVLLLAINGVTECYTNATADSATINKTNFIMIYESIVFLVASYVLTSWLGPVGFIFANCLNMASRIYHSVVFINRRHAQTNYRPLRGLVPNFCFWLSLGASAAITHLSYTLFFPDRKLLHFIIGVFMFVIVMLSWTYNNRQLIQLGIKKWSDRRCQPAQVKRD